jgi:uncharacterized protein YjgD (DUF1641 family)
MAKAVELRPVPRPAVDELQQRLDNAPKEHAEAILNAYRTLQMLHDSNALDMVRGALGAGGKVLDEGVSVITTPASIRAIRNALVLIELASQIDPALLHSVVKGIAPLVKQQPAAPPPSLWSIGKKLFSADVLRGLDVSLTVLAALGRGVAKSSESPVG